MNKIEVVFDNYVSFDSSEEMMEYLSQDVARKVREIWNTIGTEPTGKIEMRPTSYHPIEEIEPFFLGKSLGKYQMIKHENQYLLNYKPPLSN